MTTNLDIFRVNRFEADWDASTLFTGFTHRAILSHQNDLISDINTVNRVTKKMIREYGEDSDEWLLVRHEIDGYHELYLRNSGILIIWKMTDSEDFNKLFSRVEQHTDNPDEISTS